MPVEEINGPLLSYETTGGGEPLVLVHGTWVDGHTWDFVVPSLAESFFVVTYDLRGHGGSTIDPPDAGTVHVRRHFSCRRATRARRSSRRSWIS